VIVYLETSKLSKEVLKMISQAHEEGETKSLVLMIVMIKVKFCSILGSR
jgi:hypothetical protein